MSYSAVEPFVEAAVAAFVAEGWTLVPGGDDGVQLETPELALLVFGPQAVLLVSATEFSMDITRKYLDRWRSTLTEHPWKELQRLDFVYIFEKAPDPATGTTLLGERRTFSLSERSIRCGYVDISTPTIRLDTARANTSALGILSSLFLVYQASNMAFPETTPKQILQGVLDGSRRGEATAEHSPTALSFEEWSQRPRFKLHGASNVAAATFFGTPLAGSIVMALNYRALGRKASAWISLIIGLIFTIGLLALAGILVQEHVHVPKLLVTGPLAVAMFFLARLLQGREFEKHLQHGGKSASGWSAVGIALLTVSVPLLLLGTWLLSQSSSSSSTPRLQVSNNEVIYFHPPATREEAQTLAVVLKKKDFFTGEACEVDLQDSENGLEVSFELEPGGWDKEDALDAFRDLKKAIEKEAFPGHKVRIQLCDDKWSPHKTL